MLKWWNGVRKCLHDALVPFLLPWTEPSCEDIQQKALGSHISCYLHPGRDVPSICYVSCREHLKIFWSIRGNFSELGDDTWKSLQALWHVGARCSSNTKIHKCSEEGGKQLIKIFKIRVKRKWTTHDTIPPYGDQTFAAKAGSAIAKALKWNAEVMDWITYLSSYFKYELDAELSLIMALADKKAIGIVNTAAPFVNFNQTTGEFATAVRKGKLYMDVPSRGHFEILVTSLDSCLDKSCYKTEKLAVYSCSTGLLQGGLALSGVTAAVIMLMDTIFF